MKIKSLDEVSRNYAISVVTGAYKTKEYWKKQGFDEASSIEKAIQYAIGQLSASDIKNKPEEYIRIFIELASISNAFADMLSQAHSIPKGV